MTDQNCNSESDLDKAQKTIGKLYLENTKLKDEIKMLKAKLFLLETPSVKTEMISEIPENETSPVEESSCEETSNRSEHFNDHSSVLGSLVPKRRRENLSPVHEVVPTTCQEHQSSAYRPFFKCVRCSFGCQKRSKMRRHYRRAHHMVYGEYGIWWIFISKNFLEKNWLLGIQPRYIHSINTSDTL